MLVLKDLTARERASLLSFVVFGWPIVKFIKYSVVKHLFNSDGEPFDREGLLEELFKEFRDE